MEHFPYPQRDTFHRILLFTFIALIPPTFSMVGNNKIVFLKNVKRKTRE